MKAFALNSLAQVQESQQEATTQANWRASAAAALAAAGMGKDAAEFLDCGKRFVVDVCIGNPDHAPRIVPFSCHKRFCQECEHREQARKMARYIPVITDAVNFAPRDYSLKQLVLTTPFGIEAADCPELCEIAWMWVKEALQKIFFTVLDKKGKLSKEEKRRGRVDLRAHGIGTLESMEFGEIGNRLHFHIATLSPYLDIKRVVVPIWKAVTGGVCQVADIRRIHDVEKGIKEITKYVTKFTALRPELVPALARCIKGMRRVRAGGVFYGAPQLTKQDVMFCEICGLDRKLVSPLSYIARCEFHKVRPDGEIVARAESYFIQELEISSGKGRAPP